MKFALIVMVFVFLAYELYPSARPAVRRLSTTATSGPGGNMEEIKLWALWLQARCHRPRRGRVHRGGVAADRPRGDHHRRHRGRGGQDLRHRPDQQARITLSARHVPATHDTGPTAAAAPVAVTWAA